MMPSREAIPTLEEVKEAFWESASGPKDELDLTWQEYAACKDKGPDIFTLSQNNGDIDQARAICAECEVKPECLAQALVTDTRDTRLMIWAGKSPRQLRILRHANNTAARGNQPVTPNLHRIVDTILDQA